MKQTCDHRAHIRSIYDQEIEQNCLFKKKYSNFRKFFERLTRTLKKKNRSAIWNHTCFKHVYTPEIVWTKSRSRTTKKLSRWVFYLSVRLALAHPLTKSLEYSWLFLERMISVSSHADACVPVAHAQSRFKSERQLVLNHLSQSTLNRYTLSEQNCLRGSYA